MKEMICFDTYEYLNLEGNAVRSIPFSINWLEVYLKKEGITLEKFKDSYTFDEVVEMRNEYLYQMEEEISCGLSSSLEAYRKIKPI